MPKVEKLTVLENKIESYEYDLNESGSEKKLFVAFEILPSEELKSIVKKIDNVLKSISNSIPLYYKVIFFLMRKSNFLNKK